MPRARFHVQKTISIQSTSYLRAVFRCLNHALPIYLKNPNRPPVASPENIYCSSALLLLMVATDSHVNRLMYFENKGLSTDDLLLRKLAVYLPQHKNRPLLKQLEEVTACRDSIAHGLVWEETTKYDSHYKIVAQSWRLAGITKLRPKIRRVRMKHLPESRRLRLNLVPTRVGFVDLAKSLIVILQTLRELEKKYGNPKGWLGPFPHDMQLARVFLTNQGEDDWEDWVGGVLRRLHPQHQAEIQRRMHLRRIQHERHLVAGGFLPNGFTYSTPRGGPLITVPR